jgi:enoyl-CoA hydratase/carnithine racemase
MDFRTLRIERDGRVATLVLNRPDRMNAIDSVMLGELPRAWRVLDEDPAVWAIVLTGEGERAFCAGKDLREAAELQPEVDERARISPLDCGVGKPVIAAVNGACAGGGLAFVPDSDIAICSENAYFLDTRTSVGQLSIYGTLSMTRRVPLEAVFRMALLGRHERVSARRALELNLVSEVLPSSELLPRARALAATIAENSPAAVFETKRAIWDGLDRGLHDALEEGWEVVTRFARERPDPIEGARAFVEKREPRWQYVPPPKRRAADKTRGD